MKKRKIILSVLIITVLTLAVGLFCACNENDENDLQPVDYPAAIDDTRTYTEVALTAEQKNATENCTVDNYFTSGDFKIIKVTSTKGYVDRIELLVLLEGTTVKKIQNVYNNETKGHGDICFRERFLGRFEGKDLSVYPVLRGKGRTPVADDEILYVTSATVTSNAIIDAINAISAFVNSL